MSNQRMIDRYDIPVRRLDQIRAAIERVNIGLEESAKVIQGMSDSITINSGNVLSEEDRVKELSATKFLESQRKIVVDLSEAVVLISAECMELHETHYKNLQDLASELESAKGDIRPVLEAFVKRKTIWEAFKSSPAAFKVISTIISAILIVAATITTFFPKGG